MTFNEFIICRSTRPASISKNWLTPLINSSLKSPHRLLHFLCGDQNRSELQGTRRVLLAAIFYTRKLLSVVKTKRIRKMVGSFFRRLPSLRLFKSDPAPEPPAPEPVPFPYNRKIVQNALSTAVVGGLTYNSYRELIREGQEMQLKTTMNLMSLMESLQQNVMVETGPQEDDPQLTADVLKVCERTSHACTTVLGKALPTERAACYHDLQIAHLIQRIQSDPNFLERSRQRHEDVVWTSHYNPDIGLLLYNGRRTVSNAPGRTIEYVYSFTFTYPFPFPHDRMVVTLNNIVNSFRNEFDCGPWVRASQSQIREIEALLADADCVPPEPAPASSSANS